MLVEIISLKFWIILATENSNGKGMESGGTINDLFTNEESEFHSEKYSQLKKIILEEHPQLKENVENFFKKVDRKLSRQLEFIANRDSDSIIPITTFDKIKNNGGKLPEAVAEKVRKRGVLIIRKTLDENEIEEMMADLLKYMYDNGVYPSKNQTVYEIYWSKAQMKARQHPNMILAQKSLLNLWQENEFEDAAKSGKKKLKAKETSNNLGNPLMYIDRLRIRAPGDASFVLPPHIDGGGIERWKDENYRKVYRHILDGQFEDYDPFETKYRVRANMNDFGYANGCTFFRAFQGFLAMSKSGPGQGTLRVLPLLKESTAYWMLRPFLDDVPEDLFPGCFPGKTFHISNRWHPALHDYLISIPQIGPGDTVWWHADLIHSVENKHEGTDHNSVFYIPAGPDCEINRDYLRRMRHSFVQGKSPPDFPVNDYEIDFQNRATIKDLNELGRKAMGWPDVPIVKEESEMCPTKSP